MGQKAHPYGLRLGYIKTWKSRWFARKKDFANFVIFNYDMAIKSVTDALTGSLIATLDQAKTQINGRPFTLQIETVGSTVPNGIKFQIKANFGVYE